MGNLFTGWHLLLVLLVILVLFGATKLPALAKSVGQSARAFKGEMNTMKEEDAQRAATQASAVAEPGAASSASSNEQPPATPLSPPQS